MFSEKVSTRATNRPELDKPVTRAQEMRISGIAVTIVVHEHKRLGCGIELAALAEQLEASGVGLEFLTGELQGQHDPTGIVLPCWRRCRAWNANTFVTAPSKAANPPASAAKPLVVPPSSVTTCSTSLYICAVRD
ncbi:recombinase family protein [Nocardia sp. CA-084685]|uniref:recombinase family protein n=1 Tax=Nocardia sp. CA-084685 TaxID=3239970 RepID=UPI003D997D89